MSQNPLLKEVGPGEEMPGFDIDDPLLPDDIDRAALASGGYPYAERMKEKKYAADLEALQIELLKLQMWVRDTGQRLVIVFEVLRGLNFFLADDGVGDLRAAAPDWTQQESLAVQAG